MDIHILRVSVHAAADYAMGHASGDDDFAKYLESVGAWAGNLREHGYERVALVLIALKWSDPECGPPWDRVEDSQPPKRDAGAEVEAVFAREQVSRRRDGLDGLWVRRAGPVALFESRVLGAKVQAAVKATLMGQALAVEHQLDPVEAEIIQAVDRPVGIVELVRVGSGFGMGEAEIVGAVESLERRGLVRVGGENSIQSIAD